jgi:hypothetical protein
MNRLLALAAAAALASSCTPVEFEDHWMDSDSTEDISLSDPYYLLSSRIEAPTQADLETPVVIAVHGFGAATPEWHDFQTWAEGEGILVSTVLLGGHGRSLDVWIESNQMDWREPILDEYRALADLGYEHISMATMSTASPLALTHFMEGNFDDLPPLENLFLVSPFIVSQDERLYIAPVIGPILNNVPSNNNDWEKERFYTNRPHPVFPPLMDLLNSVAGQLDGEGITLPDETAAHILYAEGEHTISEEGIFKLEAGLGAAAGLETTRLDSVHHSWVRTSGRPADVDEAADLNETAEEPELFTDDDMAETMRGFNIMLDAVLGSAGG